MESEIIKAVKAHKSFNADPNGAIENFVMIVASGDIPDIGINY